MILRFNVVKLVKLILDRVGGEPDAVGCKSVERANGGFPRINNFAPGRSFIGTAYGGSMQLGNRDLFYLQYVAHSTHAYR